MNRLSMDMADWNLVPLVRRLAITDRRRPCAMARGGRVKSPRGRSIASEVSATRRTQRRGAAVPRRMVREAPGRRGERVVARVRARFFIAHLLGLVLVQACRQGNGGRG